MKAPNGRRVTTTSIRRRMSGLDQLQHKLRVGLEIGCIVVGILKKNLGTLSFDFFPRFRRAECLGDGCITPELSTAVTNAGNLSLSDEEHLAALRFAFFAPGNDPTVWLKGWHPEIPDSQRAAVAAVKAGRMVAGRHVAAPGFAAEKDPFKPESKRNEMKNEFGSRVTVMLIPYASHALIPEQPKAVVVSAGGSRACPDRRPAALLQLSTLN